MALQMWRNPDYAFMPCCSRHYLITELEGANDVGGFFCPTCDKQMYDGDDTESE
jgi:hypothetical protein